MPSPVAACHALPLAGGVTDRSYRIVATAAALLMLLTAITL